MSQGIMSWIKENKPRAIVVGVVGLLAFGFINYELIHFSSSPPFCKALCHNMALEVDQWEKSSHGRRKIDCVACHFREGLVGYAAAKVNALITSLPNSALGKIGLPMHDPHEQETLEHHYEWPAPAPLVFNEELVEEERKMDHVILPQYVHNPEVDYGFWGGPSKYADEQGNYRIQIHRHSILWNNVELNCRSCHSMKGNRHRHANSKVADFVVKNSLLTFKGKRERRRKGIIIPHAIHLDQGIGCIDCHQEIVHATDQHMQSDGVVLPRMEICFACHNDKRAPAECTLCHEMQKNMNLGVEGAGVDDTPNYMYPNSTNCTDCHLKDNKWKMTPKVCADCHGDESYGPMMTDWQNATKALLAEVGPQVEEVGRAIDQAKQRGKDTAKAEEVYEDALANYDYVANDGSKGVHNIDFSTALLNKAKEQLSAASERLME